MSDFWGVLQASKGQFEGDFPKSSITFHNIYNIYNIHNMA